jgi:hypothetical protein
MLISPTFHHLLCVLNEKQKEIVEPEGREDGMRKKAHGTSDSQVVAIAEEDAGRRGDVKLMQSGER